MEHNLNTSEVSDMSDMFMFCQSLKSIDINGFDVSKLVTAEAMFNNCKNLTTIYCDAIWDLADENSMEMFFECPKRRALSPGIRAKYMVRWPTPSTAISHLSQPWYSKTRRIIVNCWRDSMASAST